MKNYTYNFEIKDLLTQFTAAFDDTVIKRFNKNGTEAKQDVAVRYVFAPKQRVMHDIINKAQNIELPVVAIDLTSVSYDDDRVFNKLSNFENYGNAKSASAIRTPVPVNLEVNMSIMCRYMQDMEQILSNFIPYANPYIVLAWREPSSLSAANDIEIRTEVLWNKSISMNPPKDTTYSDKFRIVGDTSFTIKGWLFRNENETSNPIYFIEQNFVNVGAGFNMNQPLSALDYDNFMSSLSSETDTISLSGTPDISNIFFTTTGTTLEVTDPITIPKTNADLDQYTYQVLGDNYTETEFVMLSTNDSTMSDNLTSINTKYTGDVTGFLLPDTAWTVLNNNIMNVTFPYLSGSGRVDLIIKNPAGYTSSADIDGFYFNAQ